jgi:hypothetical protein
MTERTYSQAELDKRIAAAKGAAGHAVYERCHEAMSKLIPDDNWSDFALLVGEIDPNDELDKRIAQERLDAEAKAYDRCADKLSLVRSVLQLSVWIDDFRKWASQARERIANLQAATEGKVTG